MDERIIAVPPEFVRMEERIDARFAELRAEFAALIARQRRLILLRWVGTVLPLAGLMVALAKGWL